MSGAFGTMVSLVIVAGIIGAYGDDLVNHKSAGWAGIAFIYIYDINFSYSFGKFHLRTRWRSTLNWCDQLQLDGFYPRRYSILPSDRRRSRLRLQRLGCVICM